MVLRCACGSNFAPGLQKQIAFTARCCAVDTIATGMFLQKQLKNGQFFCEFYLVMEKEGLS